MILCSVKASGPASTGSAGARASSGSAAGIRPNARAATASPAIAKNLQAAFCSMFMVTTPRGRNPPASAGVSLRVRARHRGLTLPARRYSLRLEMGCVRAALYLEGQPRGHERAVTLGDLAGPGPEREGAASSG